MKSALVTFFTPFGRANRLAFLAGFGLLMIIPMPLGFLQTALTQAGILPRPTLGQMPVHLAYMMSFNMLLLGWMTYCLFVNRLHDLGRTGAWAFIPALLPLLAMGVMTGFSKDGFGWGVGMAIFFSPVLYAAGGLLLLCFKGNPAPNQFGARPDFANAR
jgi:uncharacterized membrane protein YhaH (DUF805 family)